MRLEVSRRSGFVFSYAICIAVIQLVLFDPETSVPLADAVTTRVKVEAVVTVT
jgi:hypothetical protein